MGSDWKQMKLGDITTWSSGGTPKKNDSTFWGGDIPWISASSMNGHLYSDSKLRVTEAGLKNGSRIAPKGTILLLVRGSILHQKMQVGMATRDVAFNQDVKCLIPKTEIVDAWFLLLWFKSKETELLQLVENTGIGAGKFDTKLIQNYIVDIPPASEMKKITEFGKALFDKEELNQKTNQTLEKMAQTLFKSWFVDFDPVIDNALAAGNPIPDELQERAELRQRVISERATNPKLKPLPDGIQQLFPSEFEESELGWIPKGWENKELSQIVKHQKGFAFKSSWYQKEGHIVVRVSDTTLNSIDVNSCNKISQELAIEYSAYALKENDLVIATVGSWPPNYSSVVGKVIRVPRTAEGGLLNQNAVKLTVSNDHSFHQGFLYSCLKNSRFMDYIVNRAQGSANQASITLKSIFNFPILLANPEVMRVFSEQVKISFEKQNFNSKQTESLTRLRDSLLPKIVSGEITINKDVA
jgi:type I restriction enzyme S subunit